MYHKGIMISHGLRQCVPSGDLRTYDNEIYSPVIHLVEFDIYSL